MSQPALGDVVGIVYFQSTQGCRQCAAADVNVPADQSAERRWSRCLLLVVKSQRGGLRDGMCCHAWHDCSIQHGLFVRSVTTSPGFSALCGDKLDWNNVPVPFSNECVVSGVKRDRETRTEMRCPEYVRALGPLVLLS